jgi:tetratricopeptide (TPR) repeat protein
MVNTLDVAVDAATRATELSPENLEILDLLANLLTRTFKFSLLVDVYQRLIRLDPMDRYFVGLASAYAECRDYNSARVAALRALELFPHAYRAHFILGHCAERQSDLLAAAHHYAQVVKGDPKHVPSLVNLAVALRSSGCPMEALDYLKEAQKLAPESVELYYNLAYSYENLGLLAEAIDMCRKALELNPDHAASTNLLAASLQKDRRSQEACDILAPYVQQHPNDCNVHCTLASFIWIGEN